VAGRLRQADVARNHGVEHDLAEHCADIVGDVALADVIRPTEITTLFVAPATTDLVGAEIELISAERRERFLADALAPVAAG
jgi:chromosome partitioning protein